MPQLPTKESVFGQRPVPRPRTAVQGYRTGDVERGELAKGEAMSGAGRQLAGVAADMQRQEEKRQADRDRMDLLKAESFTLEATTDLEDQIRRNPDHTSNHKLWNEGIDKIRKDAAPLFRNPEAAEQYSVALDNIRARGKGRINEINYGREMEHYRGEGILSYDQNTKAATTAFQNGNQQAGLAAIRNQMNVNDHLKNVGAIDETTWAANKAKIPAEMAETIASSLPPEDALKLLSQGEQYGPPAPNKVTGFDEATDFIIDELENTPEVTPDGKGNVRFGINDAANPDIDLNKLTREDAPGIYKERYWDEIGADDLPDNLRLMAYDASIVQGTGNARKWIKESGGDAKKFAELRREHFKSIGGENLPGWLARVDRVEQAAGGSAPQPQGLASLLPADVRMKLTKQAEDAVRASAKLAHEEDIITQLQNQNDFMDIISDPSQTSEQKTLQINEADLKGQITEEFGEEARRYLNSVDKINATTDVALMSEIVARMYDLNAMADISEGDYLEGVRNIKQDVMALRADGKLSGDDELKINNQMKTLMSNKVSEATQAISYSFGEANKIIERQLPPEYRGEATRSLFYATQGQTDLPKEQYVLHAKQIVDGINKQRREAVVARVYGPFQPLKPATDYNFKTEAEAEAANLPKGTVIKINGKRAEVE